MLHPTWVFFFFFFKIRWGGGVPNFQASRTWHSLQTLSHPHFWTHDKVFLSLYLLKYGGQNWTDCFRCGMTYYRIQWSYYLALVWMQLEICITFFGSSITLWSYWAYGQLKCCLFIMWAVLINFSLFYLPVNPLKVQDISYIIIIKVYPDLSLSSFLQFDCLKTSTNFV